MLGIRAILARSVVELTDRYDYLRGYIALTEGQAGEKYAVFVVDDEPIVHSMVAAIIETSGLPVEIRGTAVSGNDALRLVAEMNPDICLFDINMDGMDGLELARRITETLDCRPRIIYLTAYDRFEYAQEAIRLGAMEYILKPIRRQELISALGKAVNSLQAERIARLDREAVKSRVGLVVPSSEPPVESRVASVARDMKKYIEEKYAVDISLTSVADHLCLSPGYLGALFKSVSGVSFRAYLRAVRISKAKDLMLDHRLNLSEIAQAVGYEDVNYFSQAFLAETGVRPGEYRGSGRRWVK
jgi:two-component system, response regulator YesN